MESATSTPRTRDDLEWETVFSMCLLGRYRNLARNADKALTIFTLIGLSTAAVSVPSSNGLLASIAGVLLTATSILQITYKPAEAKIYAEIRYKVYTELLSEFNQLSETEVSSRLIRLRGEDIGIVEGLRPIAEIDTANELALKDSELIAQLNAWNKFLRFCT